MKKLLHLTALSALLFLFIPSPTTAADGPPNILWIYLEDVSGWFSCYGETLIETPNIDALAASGTRFDRFYTPAGVCSATRSAIVTGMMQTSIGALPAHVAPLPVRFREAGWHTFNEGGKDDYNFEHNLATFYDHVPKKRGWGPAATAAGECWKDLKDGQRFFGQVQLGGGKLGKRATAVVDPATVRVPPYYPDVAEVRKEIAHHYDCLLKTDEHVGELIAALKRDGLYDNTLIFMFSDHGYKLHRHKQMLHEGGIHMPLVVAGPGIAAGQVRQDLVSGIDVSAATLAASGLGVPDKMEGRDFLAEGYEPREFLIAARDRCDYTIEHIRAVVTPKFKYLRNYTDDRPYMQPTYKDGWEVTKKFRDMMAKDELNELQRRVLFDPDGKEPEEFYDLANDPHEVNNLAKNAAYAKQLQRHRDLLAGWIEETGDQGAKPESDIGLICALKRWGDRCVNPEYDRVRDQQPAAGR